MSLLKCISNRRTAFSRLLVALLALLVCVPMLAQVFLPARRITVPTPASSGISQPPQDGLAWWWVAEDVTVGDPVTNWVDRIRGAVWENDAGVGTTTPVSTADGIQFNGAANQFITTSVTVTDAGATNIAVFLIIRRTGAGAFQSTLSENNGGNKSFDWTGGAWKVYSGGPTYASDGNPGTVWFDWAVVGLRTPSDATIGYTNGVAYATNAGSYVWNVPQPFTRFGNTPGQSFTGYFRELLIYTNINSIGASGIAQMHQYATNKYGYTP